MKNNLSSKTANIICILTSIIFVLIPYPINLLRDMVRGYLSHTYNLSYYYIFIYVVLTVLAVAVALDLHLSMKCKIKYMKLVVLIVLLIEAILLHNFAFITGSALACFLTVLTLMEMLLKGIEKNNI